MLNGLVKDMAPIVFVYLRSKAKVTRISFVETNLSYLTCSFDLTKDMTNIIDLLLTWSSVKFTRDTFVKYM